MRVYIFFAFVTLAVLEVAQSCDSNINIDCASNQFKFAKCPVNSLMAYNDIKLIKQASETECKKGVNFGLGQNHVWVDSGCRAKFSLCSCKNHTVVECDSNSFKYSECNINGASKVTHIEVATQKSSSACTYRNSFGINGNTVWVHNGCRASLNVCYNV